MNEYVFLPPLNLISPDSYFFKNIPLLGVSVNKFSIVILQAPY